MQILSRLIPSLLFILASCAHAKPDDFFAIRMVDEQTGRGVPLVELRTVSNAVWVSDSAGLVAFSEPGLMGQEVFFFVRSHGYEFPRDGFGSAGRRLPVEAGKQAELRLKRVNLAERLYRITGEGIYRDSVLLGRPVPLVEPLLNAKVTGQDSTMAAIYEGRIYWFRGDTNQPGYPLGNFWTSGATSNLPGSGGLDPSAGVDLAYFADAVGFSRPMWPRTNAGVMWMDGLVVVPDAAGKPRMVARYEHMKDLGTRLEHGYGVWEDATQIFQKLARIEGVEEWRCPTGHPVQDQEHVYFPIKLTPFLAVRVRASFDAVMAPAEYEAFTPLAAGAKFDGVATRIERGPDGAAVFAWKRDAAPLTQPQERELCQHRLLRDEEARYQLRDADSGERVNLHAGSVAWNAHRQKWVLIAVQSGGKSSYLGEIWYAESDSMLGPWRWGKKIVTHERYSFYNPVHLPFFDQENGRLIYFEGTYANTFSGNPEQTPRYDYNQVMYRLDVSDPRLHRGAAREAATPDQQ